MFEKNEKWTKAKYQEFQKYLDTQKEGSQFLAFNQKLVKTKYKIIGIKVPVLRNIAKKISKTDINSFIKVAKDDTYEEVMLQGLIIGNIKEIEVAICYFEQFIPKIDNWAICDVVVTSFKIIKNDKDNFLNHIKKYLQNSHEFIVRVGIVLLLNYYVESKYIDEIFNLVDSLTREEYYINMAIAWLISKCFIKEKEKTYMYLKNNKLNQFTYNKTLQKILESFQVTDQDKEIIRKLKYPRNY